MMNDIIFLLHNRQRVTKISISVSDPWMIQYCCIKHNSYVWLWLCGWVCSPCKQKEEGDKKLAPLCPTRFGSKFALMDSPAAVIKSKICGFLQIIPHGTSIPPLFFFFYEKLVSMEFGKKQSTQPFYQSLYLYIIPLNSDQRTLCASSILNLFLRFELHLLHKIIFMEFRPKACCDQDRDHESRVTDDLKP